MTKCSEGRFRWLLLVLIVVTLGGCTSPVTPSATPIAVGEAPVETAATPLAQLTTLERTVRRLRGEDATEVDENEQAEIVENDKIQLAERAHAELRFIDDLVVELFRGTEVEILDTRLEPQGFLFLSLRQIAGSTRAELEAKRDARLQIETELMTATASTVDDQDTELVVCHKPETVTCLVTIKGAVEVASAGKTVTVKEGEAVYVFTDKLLSDPICVVQEEFEVWLARERNAEENPGLAVVVQEWPQAGCAELAAQPPTPTPLPLPSGQGMVRVGGGLYEVGHREPDSYHVAARQIEVNSFWIDAYEVSNGQYSAFINATGHAPPAGWSYGSERTNHPVKGVTWQDGQAYCSWLMKRLPSEAEWEIAGRKDGDPPRLYPWGDEPYAGGQADQIPVDDTHPVGSASFNASPFGAYDLVGNVWEWVAEPYAPVAEGHQILRGGRHGFPRDLAYRQPATPTDPSFLPFAGFRCAADQVEGE